MAVFIGLGLFLFWPMPQPMSDYPYSTVLEDRSGQMLAAQIADDGQWRFPMMDTLPQSFIDCLLTYEDKRFYQHIGIDFRAIARAIITNIRAHRIVSGASTIPMQVMRMSMNHSNRSVSNKLIEIIAAIRFDLHYSKQDILKIYAGNAPFGGNVVGLEAAAWKYFDKSPHDLSWAEMATLSVLPNAPSLITFTKNRDRLLAKRNVVLRQLLERDIIDEMELELSLAEPLATGYYALANQSPHYLQYLRRSGYDGRIHSAIYAGLQMRLNEILKRNYGQLSQNEIYNGAILVIDNASKDVVAYCGNMLTTTEEEDVDMIQAPRSTGSILKPLLYTAMIDDGMLAPDAVVADVPIYMSRFTPSNYDGQFSGLVPASEALSKSLNIPFVVMLQQYGVEKFRRQLYQAGLSTISKSGNAHYGLSLILGGAEIRLWELTQVYANMARTLLGEQDASIWSRGSIYHAFEAMTKLERPDDRGNWQLFNSSRQVAWKTGTSYGHRDAWSVGVTPDYTIGVWVGNADGEGRDQIVGVSTAGRVLFDVLEVLPEDDNWWEVPHQEMNWIPTCHHTGLLPSVHCAEIDTMLLAETVLQSQTCPYHQTVYTDSTGQWQVDQSCYDGAIASKAVMQLSPQVAKYYLSNHPSIVHDIPWLAPCRVDSEPQNLEIIYPNRAERIYIPRDLNNHKQKIIAEATHKDEQSKVYWYIDKVYQGYTEVFHSLEIDIPAGAHTLYCIDQKGEEHSVSFEVISE